MLLIIRIMELLYFSRLELKMDSRCSQCGKDLQGQNETNIRRHEESCNRKRGLAEKASKAKEKKIRIEKKASIRNWFSAPPPSATTFREVDFSDL